MNTSEFIETLVDDGLDNNTIIDFVSDQNKTAVAMLEFLKAAIGRSWSGSEWHPHEILKTAIDLGLIVKKDECIYSYSDDIKNLFGA